MLVIRNYFGAPSPTIGPALSIQTGDIIELICADIHSPWWQVRASLHLINADAKKTELLYLTLSFPPLSVHNLNPGLMF